jgi:hypothetical protein
MKLKKHNDKRRNTNSTKNKRITSSIIPKPKRPSIKDYQKSDYNNQIANKEKNRNIDKSTGLEEEDKKN